MKVELGERSYEICIGEHSIPQLGNRLDFVPQTSRMILITDENVNRLAGDKVLTILRQAGFQVDSAVIKGGEECKNMATLTSLLEQMVAFGLDRKSTVIALGGGIVGDIAGFAAATYMRGIACIQIPTTLLAQVDSSVGGKTGVNLPQGKNLVGAFFQPGLVFVDVDFIQTLPEREFLTGLAEVIKYGIIRDHEFFAYLEDNMAEIKARDNQCLIHIVNRCCAIKADIVAQDETESGLRALLNLGHTFGHAFETLTNYQQYTHGEAVAIGMVCAGYLASHLGLLSRKDLVRINNILRGYGLPVNFGDLDSTAIISQMHKDKKTIGGNMQIVMPTAIGMSRIFKDIPEDAMQTVLDSMKLTKII